MSAPDTNNPTFDPHLDIATVVFSHVQCVKTRHSLARVSRIWRDASKPAAAYPLEFDFGAFGWGLDHTWTATKPCLCHTRESLDFLVRTYSLRTTLCAYATTLLSGGV